MTHVAAQARVPKKALTVFLVVAGVLLALGVLTVLRGVAEREAQVEIVQVVDGNTVVVRRDGREETMVLAGVTAAVRNPDGVKVGPEFCMGEEAYGWLRDRLPQGAVAKVDTSDEGAPEGMSSALFTLGGKDVNADMAAAGMAAPTGVGVSSGEEEDIAAANREAIEQGLGLYSVQETCSLAAELYEASYALEQMPKDPGNSIKEIDERSVAYADAVDAVRMVQQRIAATDPAEGTFTDLAYGPAKEDLLAEADPVVEKGLQTLRDFNAKRNEIASR